MSCLSSIDDSVNTVKTDSNASVLLNGAVQKAINELLRNVENLSEATSNHSKALQEQFRELAAQVESASSPQVNNLASDTDVSAPDPKVSDSISRLCQLAQHDAVKLCDNEAQGIIDDIENILESISRHLLPDGKVPTISRKISLDTMEDCTSNARELKRIKGLLLSSQSIAINERSECVALTFVI